MNAPSNGLGPHSVEAEEAVLGSVIIHPAALIDVQPYLKAGDFFIVRHQWVYEALLAIKERGESIDYVSVLAELRKDAGRFQELGGAAFVTSLINNTPASIFTATYGRIVERAAIRRRLLAAASSMAQLAHDEDQDIDAVLDTASAELAAVTGSRQNGKDDRMSAVVSRMFDSVEAARAAKGKVGVPSGYTKLDDITGGFHRGDLIYVAGRPGMGKTSWLLSVLRNACKAGARVGLFSLEMDDEQNTQRLTAMETGISTQKMRNGDLDDREFALFTQGIDTVSKFSAFVDDRGGLSLPQLQAKALRWHNEHGLDLLMVDYIGLMRDDNANRTRGLGAISNGLKQLARQLHIPVLVASQLNRGVEGRQDKRPKLSDLRDSGELEQDADMVIFLYRDEVYNENTERPNQCDLIVAKHRNGPTGVVSLFFRKELTQFANLAKQDIDLTQWDSDVPRKRPQPTRADNAPGAGGDA
jgi:replicative DNA helicase